MKFDSLQKALELAKASLATKKIPKVDSDKLDAEASNKMKTSKHMNGKNVEQYNHEGEKKLNADVNSMTKDEAANLAVKIKAKKEQYKNINTPMADPMKVNAKLSARSMKKEEPNMASPEQPEGLKDKRKPVTHDDCGRPFAKDEMDNKIKAKMKAEMDKRKFGEADATKHVIDRDKGEKIAMQPKPKPLLNSVEEKNSLVKALDDAGHRESALLLKNWDELDTIAEEFAKSNYGPKEMGLYNSVDNAKRKANNTGESHTDVGKNTNTKKYTTNASSVANAHAKTQQKKYNKEAKSNVKVFSEKEIAELNTKMNKDEVPADIERQATYKNRV